ncbi:hypothetical protein [Gemmobacter denitrificans]|uniref:PepSY domain-containing protein n=1 Tax=Gemmobacter denitrificans TaxID=3123040 RepID=A0ABU8BS54_9RHOB
MRHLLAPLLLTLTLGLVQPAQAETLPVAVQEIVAQLEYQGYRQIKVNRTWLGRVRIVAVVNSAEREIVINPTTGEILRDYQAEPRRAESSKSGSASTGGTPESLGAEVGVAGDSGSIIDRSGTVDGKVAEPSMGVSQ